MSHFRCMVVTPGRVNSEHTLAPLLQPWHEFECTGTDDEYVQDVDKTEEYREEYREATVHMHRGPDGELVDAHDAQFYREMTPAEREKHPHCRGCGYNKDFIYDSRDWGDGLGYRTKVHFCPEGWDEVERSASDVWSFYVWLAEQHEIEPLYQGQTKSDKHKYGYVEIEKGNVVRVVRRTNPNKKWDWWQIGGRYNATLLLKDGTKTNSARKCDIDFEARARELAVEYGQWFDKFSDLFTDGIPSWNEIRESMPDDIERARAVHGQHPVVRAVNDRAREIDYGYVMGDLREEFCNGDREAFVRKNVSCLTAPFAFVHDGKWHQRAEMGWWGMTSDEKSQEDWGAEFARLLAEVPDNATLTVVDCHIRGVVVQPELEKILLAAVAHRRAVLRAMQNEGEVANGGVDLGQEQLDREAVETGDLLDDALKPVFGGGFDLFGSEDKTKLDRFLRPDEDHE